MITLQAIGWVGYYTKGDESDQLDYYLEGASSADEIQATWWLPKSLNDESRRAFAPIAANAIVEPALLTQLANGSLGTAGNVQDSFRVRKTGYDLQFAPPKSVSLLFAFGDLATQRQVVEAHLNATRAALQFVNDEGLIQARRGKKGANREEVQAFAAALFTHFSSRDDDPQLHTHAVLPNTALRQDCTVGAFDAKTLYQFQRSIGAIYTAELSAELQALGYKLTPTEAAFEVAGVPAGLRVAFSKRRRAIEQFADEQGFNPAHNRAAAQVAALKTRATKSDLTLRELRLLWQGQLAELGLGQGEFEIENGPTNSPSVHDNWSLAIAAIQAAISFDAALSRADLMKVVGEALQCSASAAEIQDIAGRLVAENVLVKLTPQSLPEDTYYSTPQMLGDERAIIAMATAGLGRRSFVEKEFVDAAVERRPTMSREQVDAARHALNEDQISIVEGNAGSGKSYALGAVAEASRKAGMDVWALGPSWRAAQVVGEDTQSPKSRVRALTGFLNDLDRGKVELSRKTVLLLDEAGMVDTPQMHRIIAAAARANCKLVLSGDTKQLTPVGPGSPMALLIRTIGTCRIEQIRRQKIAWNRAASMGFARGRAHLALRAYDLGGRINWLRGTNATLEALADQFVRDRLVDDAKARGGPLPTSQAFTGRNAVVHRLNELIRNRLQETGLVGEDAVELVVLDGKAEKSKRHADGYHSRSLRLGEGDRIVFKEQVNHPLRLIQNADTAIIEKVLAGTSPSLVVRFEPDGVRITARIEELVGFREEGAPQLPKIALAYAGTTYFGQGLTLDRAYVAATHAMSAEHIYVAMTRHRHSARLFVDVDRINVKTKSSSSSPIAKFGGGGLEKDARAIEILEEKKKRFYQECRRSGAKRNALDLFVESKPSPQGAGDTHYIAARDDLLAIFGAGAPSAFKQITRNALSMRVLKTLRLAISKFWKYPLANRGFGFGRRENVNGHHKLELVNGGQNPGGGGEAGDDPRHSNGERSGLDISPD